MSHMNLRTSPEQAARNRANIIPLFHWYQEEAMKYFKKQLLRKKGYKHTSKATPWLK